MKTKNKIFITVGGAFLVSLWLFETVFLVLLYHPSLVLKLPPQVFGNVRTAYYNTRQVIQREPLCSRFDEELGYTLKPGHCVFANIEFKTEYSINSLGLRDTQEALYKPEIIVVGDSFAMGWGVNQQEAFPKVLERKSGKKVLNAAVSSYGTAREMLLLKRLDTSAMKYLIIQYYENDYWENIVYYLNKNTLPVDLIKQNYVYGQKMYEARKEYFYGKLTLCFIADRFHQVWQWVVNTKKKDTERTIVFHDNNMRVREFTRVPLDADRMIENFFSFNKTLGPMLKSDKEIKSFFIDQDEGGLFLNAVMSAPVDLRNTHIIVLVWDLFSADFAVKLRKKLDAGDFPAYIKRLIVVDVSSVFSKEDRFILDDHLKKSAHEKTAEIIQNIIRPGGYIDQR